MFKSRLRALALSGIVAVTSVTAPAYAAHVDSAQVRVAQTDSLDFTQVDTLMNTLIAEYNVPGVGLALIRDGQIVYTNGYGFADVETKRPVTPDSVFAIGSITKSFTSLGIMQLVEQGKVNLDDPVTKYLPDFTLAQKDYTPLLKVRHLISHTSGLPRADERWGGKPFATRADAIKDTMLIQPTAKPGEIYQYCNQNFLLAGAVIEAVTGQTWEDYTRASIFTPLGIESGSFDIEEAGKASDFAWPYLDDVLKDFTRLPFTSPGFQGVKAIGPAGSINMSTRDLAAYALSQLGGNPDVASEQMLKTLHTPQVALTTSQEGQQVTPIFTGVKENYAFGWYTELYRLLNVVHHGGSIDGYQSELTLVPEKKIAVVLLSNTGTSSLAMEEVARIRLIEFLLGLSANETVQSKVNASLGLDPADYRRKIETARTYKADPAVLNALAGEYESGGSTIEVKVEGNTLLLPSLASSEPTVLYPISPTEFVVNGAGGLTITFVTEDDVTTVYLGKQEIARKGGAKVETAAFVDAQNRFSFNLPAGWTASEPDAANDVTITNPDVEAVFFVGTQAAEGTDLNANAAALLARLYPQIKSPAVDTRNIPANDQTWTQYIYVAGNGDLVVLEIILQSDQLHYVTVSGTQAAIGTATPVVNTILLSYKLGG